MDKRDKRDVPCTQSGARRGFGVLTALAGVGSLGLGAFLSAPAVADPGPEEGVAQVREVNIEGTLLLVVGDPVGPDGGGEVGEVASNPAQPEEQVLLATDDGLLLQIEGLGEEVESGDQFVGSVLVPEGYFSETDEDVDEDAAEVEHDVEQSADPAEAAAYPEPSVDEGVDVEESVSQAGAADDAESAQAAEQPAGVRTEIAEGAALEAAQDAGVVFDVVQAHVSAGPDDLPVAHADAEQVAAGAYPLKQHSTDVVILKVSGLTTVTPAQATAALKRGTDFWASNAGEIISWGTPGTPVSRVVSKAVACDYAASWRTALAATGKSARVYQNTGRHLVVYAPKECMSSAKASGFGVIGTDPHYGGMTWLAGNNGPITAHELGHNLSLRHADAADCWSGGSDVPRNQDDWSRGGLECVNRGYQDQYDVMGSAYTLGPDWGMCGSYDLCWWGAGPLPALSIAHRDRLGISEGTITRIGASGGAVQTVTLDGMGSSGAKKGLVVTDPVSGERLYAEFRDGGGTESGTLYSQGYGSYIASGVKLSREKSIGSLTYYGTAALPRYSGTSGGAQYFFRAGDTFVSRTKMGSTPAVKVKVVNTTWGANAKATLQVTFGTSATASVQRLSGSDRYATSVAVSKDTYPSTRGGVVFVATGNTFPDALAAAPAAAELDAPLLLVPTAGTLPPVVAAELARLAPAQVYVIGGAGAVSEKMAAQVATAAKTFPAVTRLKGATRYETAAAVANEVFGASPDDDLFGWPAVFIATGRNFPDALSASAAAGSLGVPVLLTDGKASALDTGVVQILKRMKPDRVYLVGGPGVVSPQIAQQVSSMGFSTKRLSGSDRYTTSAAVAAEIFKMDQHYPSVSQHYWATGVNFPDALSGAPAAARAGAPLYVVRPDCVPGSVLSHLSSKDTQVVKLLGGAGVLRQGVATMRSCGVGG